MSIASHKCTILQKALNGELVTAAQFQISNCNQYLVELENDGYLKLIYEEPETGKKYRTIANTEKAINFIAAFAPNDEAA